MLGTYGSWGFARMVSLAREDMGLPPLEVSEACWKQMMRMSSTVKGGMERLGIFTLEDEERAVLFA